MDTLTSWLVCLCVCVLVCLLNTILFQAQSNHQISLTAPVFKLHKHVYGGGGGEPHSPQ